jgi:AcrR family transcriptional regulator
MPKVSQAHKDARILDLYRATWQCIAEEGLEHLTLEHVIAASGFTAGMVYHYFSGREELVQAASQAAIGELRLAMDSAAEQLTDSPAALFERLIESFAAKAAVEPYAMATASHVTSSRPPLGAPDSSVTERYGSLMARFENHARHWIELGTVADQASPHELAQFVTAVAWGYFAQRPLAPASEAAGYLRVFRALGRVGLIG